MLIKVDLDPTIIKKIEELITLGQYSDIRQFLSIAVSNQLEEESNMNQISVSLNRNHPSEGMLSLNPLKTVVNTSQTSIAKSFSNWRQRLLDLVIEPSQIQPKSADVIWYFYNRFFPIKLVINQLAKIIVTQQNNWIELGDVQVQSFEFAQEVATKLKNVEIRAKIPRNKKLSTGLPASNMELMSLRGMAKRRKDDKLLRGRARFMDQIVGKFVPKQRTFSGACFDLGLIGIRQGEESTYLSLTDLGKEFALLENPILDNDSFEKAFSDKEIRFIFQKIYSRFPLEIKIVNRILERLKKEDLMSPEIDELFKDEKNEFLIEERIATMGRLSELQIVNWQIDTRGKSVYSLNEEKFHLIK